MMRLITLPRNETFFFVFHSTKCISSIINLKICWKAEDGDIEEEDKEAERVEWKRGKNWLAAIELSENWELWVQSCSVCNFDFGLMIMNRTQLTLTRALFIIVNEKHFNTPFYILSLQFYIEFFRLNEQ